jgi:threonine synthase
MIRYVCTVCQRDYALDTSAFQCECSGVFTLNYTLETDVFRDDLVDTAIWSQLRYHATIPYLSLQALNRVSLGEGMTPLVPLMAENMKVLVKMDYHMPTGSFKDRGAAVLVALALELGAKEIVQDSSGNAGASIAAYASRAGIPCKIFVPLNTSQAKLNQIKAYGASIQVVEGSRQATADAAFDAAKEPGVFYASHVFNPFFHQGTKTYIYEIFESMGFNLPDYLVVPVGNGTLLLGVYEGLKDLRNLGLITHYPKIIAVQSARCAPIYEAFVGGASLTYGETVAEGIAIREPKRLNEIVSAIRATKGEVLLAAEETIDLARGQLSKLGFYVEPTTAATFAAYFSHIDRFRNGTVVLPLCGSGLKK